MSSCASSRSTLRRICASCARERSSQKTAGAPVARARPTASRTQSATGASLVWHARQTSPGSTSCSSSVVAAGVDDADRARGLDLEGLVVTAVLLRLLGHQADVGRRAHGRRIERAVLAAEVDRLRVQGRVARVGDHRLDVLLLARRVPHLPRGADHRRHRRVDDHVARHVQAGDPAVGVDHRERRPGLVGGGDRLLDLLARVRGQELDRGEHARQAVRRVGADLVELVGVRARTRPRSTRGRRGRR